MEIRYKNIITHTYMHTCTDFDMYYLEKHYNPQRRRKRENNGYIFKNYSSKLKILFILNNNFFTNKEIFY